MSSNTRAESNMPSESTNPAQTSKDSKTTGVINFMGVRKFALALSLILVLGSIVSLFVNGLNFGLDFTGGALIEVQYKEEPDLVSLRQTLVDAGYVNSTVQSFGSSKDVLIRMAESHNENLGDQVLEVLEAQSNSEVTLRRSEFVGSQVGEELREQGGLGMLVAVFLVMIYLAFRFQYKFSIGAVAALVHDVFIVLGIFSLLQLNFDLTVLAAILAVIGYSLNDTIVVADRIRENFRKMRKGDSEHVINVSLSQTLGRTIVTSLTTLLVLLALVFLGGELIHGFAIALIVGVVVGTYSSIYVASNTLLFMNIVQEDLLPPETDEEEEDDRP